MKTISWTCAAVLVAALMPTIGCQKIQQKAEAQAETQREHDVDYANYMNYVNCSELQETLDQAMIHSGFDDDTQTSLNNEFDKWLLDHWHRDPNGVIYGNGGLAVVRKGMRMSDEDYAACRAKWIPEIKKAGGVVPVAAGQSDAEAAAPVQGQAGTADTPSAPTPEFDNRDVDVVETAKVWNDWRKSTIVAVHVRDREGDDIYFACDTVMRDARDQIMVIDGKVQRNPDCFLPDLHTIYTLKALDSQNYWMNPPGDDGSDEMDGRHVLVQPCPQCEPGPDDKE